MQLNDKSLFKQQCFIDGQWVDADSGDTAKVLNPANGDVLGTMPNAGAAETRRAIEAANAAWPGWRRLTAKERAKYIRGWYDLILANADDLAMLMTLEQVTR